MNIIEIPFEIINLDDQQNILLIINAQVGEHPVRLVMDTGASHSCLSKKIVKNLTGKKEKKAEVVIGIGRGRLSNKLVHIPSFKIGDLEIQDYPFLILSLNHINKMLSLIDVKTIDGFLGSDILYAYKAVIDYETQTIRLQDKH
jgi:hypothetical protein